MLILYKKIASELFIYIYIYNVYISAVKQLIAIDRIQK